MRVIVLILLLLLLLCIYELDTLNTSVREGNEHICGLVTGVAEFKYVNSVLYCRTKSGDLTKPTKAKFQLETITKKGVKHYNYVPRRECN